MAGATAAPTAAGGDAAPETPLNRVIGRRALLYFVVGDILGAGIYALVGEVGGRVGGAIWAAFAVALALAVFTAFAYAELVTKYPRAAGAALYTHKAFRAPFFTFMVAFAVMASGITSASTLARAFGGDYLSEFVELPTVLVALVFIVLVAGINFRGISESVKLNIALTTIEVLGLLLIAVIALAAVLSGDGEPSRAFDLKEGEGVVSVMIAGAALAFYALIGFEDSVNVAEETQEPHRDYPRALFGGLAIAGAIYLVVAILASMAVPTGKLADSSGPLLEVVQVGPLAISTKIFAAIALFALANGALINMIMASRIVYGMSRQGILPKALGGVNESRRTPLPAILFTTAIAMILIASGDLATLADMTVLLLLVVFIVVNIAVLRLRSDVVRHQHFRAPTIMPVLGIGVSVLLMTKTDGEIFGRAAILLAVGALLWVINRLIAGPAPKMDTEQLEAVQKA